MHGRPGSYLSFNSGTYQQHRNHNLHELFKAILHHEEIDLVLGTIFLLGVVEIRHFGKGRHKIILCRPVDLVHRLFKLTRAFFVLRERILFVHFVVFMYVVTMRSKVKRRSCVRTKRIPVVAARPTLLSNKPF